LKYPNDFINKIICGDSLKILKNIPDKSVDLVLTDPPYGIGKMVSGTMSKKRLHKSQYDVFEDSEEYVKNICVPIIKECIRIAHRVILTPGSKCMMLYPKSNSFGCLFFPAATGMQLWGSMDSQPIFYYGKPYDIGKRIHRCSYEVYERPSCKEHPCSKPINLWKTIIEKRTKENDIVLDPFLGSGTTAVACKSLGRRYIGIEISPKYCEIAKARVNSTTEPLFV
jgi:site-specific DNA-methyltransferase (adenine-specific)